MKQSSEDSTPTKLTWKQFKELCEQQGIQDNDELDIIDVSWGSLEYFSAKKDEDFGWQITLRGI